MDGEWLAVHDAAGAWCFLFFVRARLRRFFRLLGPGKRGGGHAVEVIIGRAGISHSCFLFALEVCVPNPFPLDPLYHNIPSLSLSLSISRADSEEGDREVAGAAADADSGGTASTVRWVVPYIISCFFAMPVDSSRAHYFKIHAC